jgi:hypothetical protein
MQLTLEMEWHDAPGEIIKQLLPVALACDLSFAERNEKQFLNTAPWLNSNFQEG